MLPLIGEKQTFLQSEDRTTLENIVSSEIFGVRFTNELTKTMSNDKQF